MPGAMDAVVKASLISSPIRNRIRARPRALRDQRHYMKLIRVTRLSMLLLPFVQISVIAGGGWLYSISSEAVVVEKGILKMNSEEINWSADPSNVALW